MSVWLDFLTYYHDNGSRVSPVIDLSPVGVALDSEITWASYVPEDTTLAIEIAVSKDKGSTWGPWQACVNGQAVPGIAKGDNLTNTRIKVRESFSTLAANKTAQLQNLYINIQTAYKRSGIITSIVLDASLAVIDYDVSIYPDTEIIMEYRELQGEDNWSGWAPITNNQMIGGKDKLQYRAIFTTEDVAITPVLHNIRLSPIKYFASGPSVSTSEAKDEYSGKVLYEAGFTEGITAEIRTRTSADGSSWGPWEPIDSNGNIASIKQNYAQVLIITHGSGKDDEQEENGEEKENYATFYMISISYDGTPEAEELANGFTSGSQFYFTTLMSKLIVTNKLDPPWKWDGEDEVEELGGSPPRGQYTAAHKNYLFMAHTNENPSRLYWSDLLTLETWGVLSYIDISPNDGDWITGVLPFSDYLIITKQRSVWVLVGDGPSSFEVRRIHDGIGCIAPRSLVKMEGVFSFVGTEGVYFSDLNVPVVITERLKETWDGLNKRRLNQAASAYYDHKLRIDLPDGGSTKNNIRIIYDNIRKALYLQEFLAHASCYATFIEAGQEVLLYGHSTEGQVSRADTGTTDAGAPITMDWGTKWFNFGSSAVEKKVRRLYLVCVPAISDTELNAYLIVDGVEGSSPLTVIVPGSSDDNEVTLRLSPRDIDVRKIRTLGYRIAQSTVSGGVQIHELLQEFRAKKVKAT